MLVDMRLNTITDPPFLAEKNKFSSQPSENPSISGRIEPPVSRCGMLWIIGMSVYIVGKMTCCSASGEAKEGLVGLYALVWKKIHICDRWDGRISPSDGRPSTRCGNVAVVALCLLVNRKMCFYGI